MFSLIAILIAQVSAYYVLDGPIEQVVWCDVESYILTSKGSVYRNYINETAKFIALSGTNNFTILEIMQSPADKRVLYFFGDQDLSFNTKNCGRNYTILHHEHGLHDYRLNVLQAQTLMAFKDTRCKNGTALCKEKYRKHLYVSDNYGETWRKVLERVRDAAWDKLIALPEVPDHRIVASHLHENGSVLVSHSDDFYRTLSPLRWNGYGFYQTKEYLFTLIDADEFSKGYDLEVTKSGRSNLTEIVLPIEDKQTIEYTFTVLDTVKGSIFISVTHTEDLPKISNVYQSDTSGTQYSLSLLNNVRSLDTGNCDFEPIIDGVYIANIYENQEYEKIKMRRTSKNTDALKRLENYKQTRITFDRGGQWQALRAPKYDFKGTASQCSGDCSLHLLGRSEAPRNRIISNSHIIVATGNTGLYLGNQHNTYLSRDSGHTWYEILEGTHVYEIGDNTGAIVFVNDDDHAKEILYTWDDGLTFKKLAMNVTIDITSVVFKNGTFIFHGVQDAKTLGMKDDITQSSLRGMVVALDIKSIMTRKCERFDEPGIPDSDYEYWSPTNAAGEKCIFGKRVKYVRRKRNANCFNEQEDLPVEEESCPCTKEDWECDVGFKRDANNTCVPMKVIKPPLSCRGTYVKSQGYRLIPGDECQGGVQLGPIEVQCNEEDQVTTKADIKKNSVRNEPEAPSIPDPVVAPTRQGAKKYNKTPQQPEKGGVKWGYLFLGIGLLAITLILKKKYIDRKRPPKAQRGQYFPAKSSERQSLFSEI